MSLPLESVARAASGSEPEMVRVRRVLQQLQPLPPAEREAALTILADTLAAHDPAGRFLRCLADAAELPARLLALELAGRWPAPLDRALAPVLRPLLLDRRLLPGAQLGAAVALLRAVGKDGPTAVDLVRSLVTGLDAAGVRERLDLVEQRLGESAAVDELRRRLAEKLSTHCPRCGVALQRPDMLRHLWERHGLVLDAGQAREPWALLEDWLTSAAAQRNAERLARCFELALHLDPAFGLARLDRLLVAYGFEDEATECRRLDPQWRPQRLRCPECATETAVPRLLPVLSVQVGHGILAAAGYRVEVNERGCRPQLTVELPSGVVQQGREPGQRFSPHVVVWLLVGPPVIAAFLLAWFSNQSASAALTLVLGLGVWLWLWYRSLLRDEPLDRAVDHAWELLAPRLHAQGFTITDSAFVAGLAQASIGRGRPQQRERALERASLAAERALAAHPGAISHLACLQRLAAEDSQALGRDPVAQLLRPLTRCLDGTLPLRLADRLLADWTSAFWSAGNLARLRVLLCERAFDGELEVVDLIEAGELAPALGAVLETDDAPGLARLRLLWTHRTRRPWDDCGEAFTAFELAAQSGPGAAPLAAHPDLLLYQLQPGAGRLAAVAVCGSGVLLAGQRFDRPTAASEIAARTRCGEGLARRVEGWLRFLFEEFMPQATAMAQRRASPAAERWSFPEATPCARCGQRLLPME
ncbi:MAG: hypothetical protein JNM56_17740 [Planctomycetia bacterium]|nr:hypothetical protein [Planctomycetia bacterium]